VPTEAHGRGRLLVPRPGTKQAAKPTPPQWLFVPDQDASAVRGTDLDAAVAELLLSLDSAEAATS
jgi:hypothetical protein